MRFLRLRGPRTPAVAVSDVASVAVHVADVDPQHNLAAHPPRIAAAAWRYRLWWGRCIHYISLMEGKSLTLRYFRRTLKRKWIWGGAAVLLLFALLTILFVLLLVIVLQRTWESPRTRLWAAEWLGFDSTSELSIVVPGAFAPREPERLPGLNITRARLLAPPGSTAAAVDAEEDARPSAHLASRLLELYGDSMLLYTFGNGTELNHAYRRAAVSACGNYIKNIEVQLALYGTVANGQGATVVCTNPMQQAKTNAEVIDMVRGRAAAGVTSRDRETDELRYSVRSVEQHMRWHRGRLVVVSPGHHPTWVDGAKNFLAGVCGGADVQALRRGGTHVRLTTVHQDAVLPPQGRMTFNTNTVEANLWRVRNITAVHVYMNDDYFVNRDVAITDLLNEYGGTIVRTESDLIQVARISNHTLPQWSHGVAHTNFYVTEDLDMHHEDEVPKALLRLWQQQSPALLAVHAEEVWQGRETMPSVTEPDLHNAMFVWLETHKSIPPRDIPLPLIGTAAAVRAAYESRVYGAIRPRFYAAHAPFVYCTNMLRYLALRYQREMAAMTFTQVSRSATDLYMPFLYNAYIMARPWAASPRFPAYLLLRRRQLEAQQQEEEGCPSPCTAAQSSARESPPRQTSHQALPRHLTSLLLDNGDGCAPATMFVGAAASGAVFGRFTNVLSSNEAFVTRLARAPPLFFNINAGFDSAEAAQQLRTFLHGKYPTPAYLEERDGGGAEDVLGGLFRGLMALPVVGVVSFEEGACPLVRSLALAFAGHHRGRVEVVVQRHGLGEVDPTLQQVRGDLRFAQRSAMPAVMCAYGARVRVGASSARGEPVAAVARRVLDAVDAGAGAEAVVLPSTCGGGSGGLRVRGFVVDARTAGVPLRDARALRGALATPGQTVSLEDFRAVRVGPTERDVALVLSRSDADAKAVHWVSGASENDLLVTFPLPVAAYEDMAAEVRWVEWTPDEVV